MLCDSSLPLCMAMFDDVRAVLGSKLSVELCCLLLDVCGELLLSQRWIRSIQPLAVLLLLLLAAAGAAAACCNTAVVGAGGWCEITG